MRTMRCCPNTLSEVFLLSTSMLTEIKTFAEVERVPTSVPRELADENPNRQA